MHFRRTLVTGAIAASLAVTVGCGSSSSGAQNFSVSSDVILGSSDLSPFSTDSPDSSPLPTVSDAVPQVPHGAVMAATVIVDSGQFKGTSKITSTGTVGCSYSLFGDKQWRINFTSEGEFESKDTTASGRRVFSFGITTQDGGTADIAVTFNSANPGVDLEDKNGAVTVRDDGMSVTFTYIGRHSDGTLFHGAALCTKPLRNQ